MSFASTLGSVSLVVAADRIPFAVVREDADLEAALVEKTGATQVLLVCSGGCTAMNLRARWPQLGITVFDRNPGQLRHFQAKLDAVRRKDFRQLNVDHIDASALNQCGSFEGLFRIWRSFVTEMVASAETLERFFDPAGTTDDRRALLVDWQRSRYWSTAFQIGFGDPFLHAMFGPAATQHAVPGSYPGYFQRVFERGLSDPRAHENPFLQHILLQRYRPEQAPLYTRGPVDGFEVIEGTLLEVPELRRFQVVSLSNVFDWSDDRLVGTWTRRLAQELSPGTAILIRQLNNQRPLQPYLEPAFRVDESLSGELLAQDRSLFYERIIVAFRTDEV